MLGEQDSMWGVSGTLLNNIGASSPEEVKKQVVDKFTPPTIPYTPDERINEPWLPAREEPPDFFKPGRYPEKQLFAYHFA